MAIKYNMYGSPQIYGAPQVQRGKDRKYQQAFFARELENKNAMDLLLKAYNTNIEKNRVVTATREVGIKNDIYDSFFADTANTKITRRATTGNDLLLGARTAEELLQLAEVVKPTRGNKAIRAYNVQLTAAQNLISQATTASQLGGNAKFDLGPPVNGAALMAGFLGKKPKATEPVADVPTKYSFDKFSTGITEALTKKYSSLGELQRGLLQNETATTTDDEKVIFSNNNAYQVQNEYANMQKNWKTTTAQINTDFTKYGQDQKKIGMYQTASLSEDQMYKKILSDIEASYTTFNSTQGQGYVADTYINPQATNIDTTSDAYLASLPTTIRTP
tara:strand:- start:3439 stop:4437 length:999 start_codon:yes stop_codon:yes gene_type:complete